MIGAAEEALLNILAYARRDDLSTFIDTLSPFAYTRLKINKVLASSEIRRSINMPGRE